MITSFLHVTLADAAVSYTYTSDDGNLRVTMTKSTITIYAESKAASTDIRWRTIGLNLDRKSVV
jgi:hypothetical protein